ncbi:PBS lyase HEAT domain protein repeat-containing protein [Sphingobium chlorophenolicum L-1]|uniref:PBS lyase HEAT domain protein repeat-containing protein n=1 Tax=Sphingobium chlorophenolicum L-1 TaxID=690566 RepID=F6F3J8_SPHCR|nr:HEAT repeat domain-containing protein [Sphingobium chlorophenolicum]AEG51010.1 PBS lyase HEAT domain protein repeat-containing protein [Sphingobium chlorophenolicum L-1]
MTVMPIPDHVAQIAIFVSFYGALGMAAVLLFLVIRRGRTERAEAQAAAMTKALIREIMGGELSGEGEDVLSGPVFRKARAADKLAAIGRMIQLLRGEERERLIALVQRHGLLKDALRRTYSLRRRTQVDAMRILGSIGGAPAVDTLLSVLHGDPHIDTRLEAASLLAQLDALPAPERLIRDLSLYETRITPLHRSLFRLLAVSHPVELMTLGRSNQLPPAVRALVIDALGWTEDYAALPLLAAAAVDPHPPVRLAALDSATRLGHPGSAGWIIRMLEDPEHPVRSRAIRACQIMGLTAALPLLAAMRDDPSPWVRLRAQQAVQMLKVAA